MTIAASDTVMPPDTTGFTLTRSAGPDTDETDVAVEVVSQLLTNPDLDGKRIGVLWASSNAGARAYRRILERLGHPRKRVIAAAGPLSGANGVTALIGTRFRMNGPSVSMFGPWTDHHLWLAEHYISTGQASLMVAGFSHVDDDLIVAGARLVGRVSPQEDRYDHTV